jgi:hypothetical protein
MTTPPATPSATTGTTVTVPISVMAPANTEVAAAEACRWDGLHFGKCTFILEEMESWLDSVRANLYTRKASFLLTGSLPGDENLQTMCLLALKAALPAAKRPMYQSYNNFTTAFQALVKNCESAKKSAALTKQVELINLIMHSSETLVSYLDRAAALWGALQGSSQAIDEESALHHAFRGLNSAHSWFLALATASQAVTFAAASDLALQHANSRVAINPEVQHFSGRKSNDFRNGGGRGRHERRRSSYHGNRPHCSKCNRHHFQHENCHQRRPHPSQGRGRGASGTQPQQGSFHHTIGNIEFNTAEAHQSEGVELSLCVDSGATHVITPDRGALSNYSEKSILRCSYATPLLAL